MEIGQNDLGRLDWFGIKSRISKVLALRSVNPLVRFAARHLLPRTVGQRLPLARPYVTYRLASGGAIRLLDPLNDIIARDIYWGEGRPTSGAEANKLRCIEHLSRKSSSFLDIGAYGGVCALVAARSNPFLRSVAFEIVPQNYKLLLNNILENNLATRIEARLCGIGASSGTIRFPTSLKMASNPTSMSIASTFENGVEIRVEPLNGQLQGLTAPFLVKIDVEGFEAEVFEGAMLFISTERPDIICEVLPDADKAVNTITNLLQGVDYDFYVFTENGLIKHAKLETQMIPRDWLLTVRSSSELLLDIF